MVYGLWIIKIEPQSGIIHVEHSCGYVGEMEGVHVGFHWKKFHIKKEISLF